MALGGKRNHYYYGCSYHHNRGATVCINDHKVRVETLDQEVLSAIQMTILTPEAIDYVIDKALSLTIGIRASFGSSFRTGSDASKT